MSGTSLILLAMCSTVNLVNRAGAAMSTLEVTLLMALLMSAAALTCAAIVITSLPPNRAVPKGPTLLRAKRRLARS